MLVYLRLSFSNGHIKISSYLIEKGADLKAAVPSLKADNILS